MQQQHNACMPSITIRDVSPEARDELAARARRSGRSLQEYLRAELERLAAKPDAATVMARVRARKEATGVGLSREQILGYLHDERA